MSEYDGLDDDSKVFSRQPFTDLQLILIALAEVGLAITINGVGTTIQASIQGGMPVPGAVQVNNAAQASLEAVITSQMNLLAWLKSLTP